MSELPGVDFEQVREALVWNDAVIKFIVDHLDHYSMWELMIEEGHDEGLTEKEVRDGFKKLEDAGLVEDDEEGEGWLNIVLNAEHLPEFQALFSDRRNI